MAIIKDVCVENINFSRSECFVRPGSTDPPNGPMQVIFLQGSLFDSFFKTTSTTRPNNPDLSKFQYLSHVRSLNSQGVANSDGTGTASYSVAFSPRPGPLGISRPTVVHAHLISLSGVANGMVYPTPQPLANPPVNTINPLGLAGLVSLYSWSYTCIPDESLALNNAFKQIGASIQPLRRVDSVLADPGTAASPPAAVDTTVGIPIGPPKQPLNIILPVTASLADDWVKERMLAGYNLVRQRLPTGETSIGFFRGLLSPIKPDPQDFPPSDSGTDLAIINKGADYADITYQLAWELGRTLSISDRPFAGALARLRGLIHDQASTVAKKNIATDYSFVPAATVYTNLTNTLSGITSLTNIASIPISGSTRWQRTVHGNDTRAYVSFLNENVQAEYVDILQGLKGLTFAKSTIPTASKPLYPRQQHLNLELSEQYQHHLRLKL